MSDAEIRNLKDMTESERDSGLFSNLVMQQFSMAMMLMGRAAGPSGEAAPPKDLEAARLFIDQLEMIERKTKGNLSKEEDGLVKQALMNLRLVFVEAVEEPQKGKDASPPLKEGEKQETPAQTPDAASNPSEESHKKFTKKY
jgi:hypothetical protein